MLAYLLTILAGLAGGMAVGIQSPLAGAIGQRVGGTASSFIVHLSGMILSGALLTLRGGEKKSARGALYRGTCLASESSA